MGQKEKALKSYCECGGGIMVSGPHSEFIFEIFEQRHQGPGHKERVTADEAAKIRQEKRAYADARLRARERTAARGGRPPRD